METKMIKLSVRRPSENMKPAKLLTEGSDVDTQTLTRDFAPKFFGMRRHSDPSENPFPTSRSSQPQLQIVFRKLPEKTDRDSKNNSKTLDSLEEFVDTTKFQSRRGKVKGSLIVSPSIVGNKLQLKKGAMTDRPGKTESPSELINSSQNIQPKKQFYQFCPQNSVESDKTTEERKTYLKPSTVITSISPQQQEIAFTKPKFRKPQIVLCTGIKDRVMNRADNSSPSDSGQFKIGSSEIIIESSEDGMFIERNGLSSPHKASLFKNAVCESPKALNKNYQNRASPTARDMKGTAFERPLKVSLKKQITEKPSLALALERCETLGKDLCDISCIKKKDDDSDINFADIPYIKSNGGSQKIMYERFASMSKTDHSAGSKDSGNAESISKRSATKQKPVLKIRRLPNEPIIRSAPREEHHYASSTRDADSKFKKSVSFSTECVIRYNRKS